MLFCATVGMVLLFADRDTDRVSGGSVTVGSIEIPVAGSLSEHVYLGALGPSPQIDIDLLGVSQLMNLTPTAPPGEFGLPAVLVGSNPSLAAVPGYTLAPIFVFEHEPGLRDRVGSLIGSSHATNWQCLGSVDGVQCVGRESARQSDSSPWLNTTVAEDPAIPVVLVWFPLPVETSVVVAIDHQGRYHSWQRPVGRLALLVVPMDPGKSVQLEAWDSTGGLLARDVHKRCDFHELMPSCSPGPATGTR